MCVNIIGGHIQKWKFARGSLAVRDVLMEAHY